MKKSKIYLATWFPKSLDDLLCTISPNHPKHTPKSVAQP